jgi:O-antigen/teichoic acid export membrane protein
MMRKRPMIKATTISANWHNSKALAAIFGWAGVGMNAIGQLALSRVIVRTLGSELLPIWQVAFQCFSIALLSELGIMSGITRIMADAKTPEERSSILHTSRRICVWIGAIFVLCMLIGSRLLKPDMGSGADLTYEFSLTLLIFAAWGAIRYSALLPLTQMFAQGKVALNAVFRSVIAAARPLSAAVAVMLSRSYVAIPLLYVASEALTLWYSTLITKRHSQEYKVASCRMERSLTKRILSFGLGCGAMTLSNQATTYIIPLIIAGALGFKSASIYSCSLMLPLLVQRLIAAALQVWFPTLVEWRISRTENKTLPPNIRRILPAAIVGLAIAGTVVALFNHLFVSMWVGSEFSAGHAFAIMAAISTAIFALLQASYEMTRAYCRSAFAPGMIAIAELCILAIVAFPVCKAAGIFGVLILTTTTRLLRAMVSVSIAHMHLHASPIRLA